MVAAIMGAQARLGVRREHHEEFLEQKEAAEKKKKTTITAESFDKQVADKMGEFFDHSQFRPRFVAKGRMRTFLEPIATYVITEEFPAFLGLAELVESNARRR